MAKDQRDPLTKERDLEIISEKALMGWSQIRIAEHLGLSQSTVSRDLAVVKKRWAESARENIDAIKSQELAKLQMLHAQAMDAYERSKQPIATATKTTSDKGETVTQKKEERVGNPHYLRLAMDISDRIRKLMGADAPEQMQGELEIIIRRESKPKN